MTEKEYIYLLMHVAGVGAVSIFKLGAYFSSYREAWRAGEKELKGSGILSEKRIQAFLDARKKERIFLENYEKLERNRIRFVAYMDDEYPKRLLPYDDKPAGLFVRGNLPEEERAAAAIVGARNCTEYGRMTANQLSAGLTKAGVQIISGLALGIDGAAHKGALRAGGNTYAVLGCGVNICYPRENSGLFWEMEEHGGILSEFVLGTNPASMNFPMRNRIISGLSDAVIVVEARERSGSLITAGLALEQGKEVFAVPGRIMDPLSAGCNELIQCGAAVCTGVGDVLDFFGMKQEKKLTLDKKTEKALAKNENMVYSFLDSRPGNLEEVMKECKLSVGEAAECLLKLELLGLVQGDGNQYYCRKL